MSNLTLMEQLVLRPLLRLHGMIYAKDSDSYLDVVSLGGSDEHPGRYHHLRSRPDCEINIGPIRFAVRARKTTPDDADYRSRTLRPIPVIALTPRLGE